MYKVKAMRDRALFGYSFLNLTDTAMNMDRCLAACLEDCRCMSFQICNDQICQLCSTNKDLDPSALRKAEGCMNFFSKKDFEKVSSWYTLISYEQPVQNNIRSVVFKTSITNNIHVIIESFFIDQYRAM